MSATRDKSQKFTFLYSNLYQIYKRQEAQVDPISPDAGVPASDLPGHTGQVIKVEDRQASAVRVTEYQAPHFIQRRVSKPASLPPSAPSLAMSSLKENLQKLQDLHSRLKFMLQELEDLSKK